MEYWKTDRAAAANWSGRIAAIALLTALASGCGSSPPTRFYTLSAVGVPTASQSNLSVSVGPVSVPAVVDRPQIVVSTGANQVVLDEFNQWAAPLQNEISRVVTENLVSMVGSPQVTLSSQMLGANAAYRVAIDVQRFESMPGQAAIFDAVWNVRRSRDGESQLGRTMVREAATEMGYAALAAAHSRAVARLSQDIANALSRFAGTKP